MKEDTTQKQFNIKKERRKFIFIWGPLGILLGSASLWISYNMEGEWKSNNFLFGLVLGSFFCFLIAFFVFIKYWKRKLAKKELEKSRKWITSSAYTLTIVFSVIIGRSAIIFLKSNSSLEVFFMSFAGVLFLICSPIAMIIAIFNKGMYQK